MKELKSTIENFDVISFDVFDTLLLRPYLTQEDLWLDLGRRELDEKGCAAFLKARIAVDKKTYAEATKRGGEHTLEEAYRLMPKQYASLMAKEEQLQRECLVANPEMLEVWKRTGELGKKRIIVSDMYLSEAWFAKTLKEKGLGDYDALYVSSMRQARKSSGKLFEIVKKDFAGKQILHIGDNRASDVGMASRIGIRSILSESPVDQFLKEFSFARQFLVRNASLEGRMLVACLARFWKDFLLQRNGVPSYWHKIGFALGGVLAAGFLSWIKERVKDLGIKRLLFVARDGYSLEKIWKHCEGLCSADYIYAPRAVARSTDRRVLNEYCQYVNQFNLPKNGVAVVDTNTINFSSEKLLCKTIEGSVVHGLYANALCGDERGDAWFHSPNFSLRWPNLMELLFMAPTPPVSGVTKVGPIFLTDVTQEEAKRIEIYPEISDAEIFSAVALLKGNISVTREIWLDWVDSFIYEVDKEKHLCLGAIKHGTDAFHKKLTKVVTDPNPTFHVREQNPSGCWGFARRSSLHRHLRRFA